MGQEVAGLASFERTLARLEKAGLRRYAITGSLALPHQDREARDLDLVVASFADLPRALSAEFLCIHAHAGAPSGKLLLQLVAADDPVRIDIFGAVGQTLTRTTLGSIGNRAARFVCVEDLAVRLARTLLALGRGDTVPRKFAIDFPSIVDALDPKRIEIAWKEHRAGDDPESFDEACNQIALLLALHDDLLIEPRLSKNVDAICERCNSSSEFPLASPHKILGILGYC